MRFNTLSVSCIATPYMCALTQAASTAGKIDQSQDNLKYLVNYVILYF